MTQLFKKLLALAASLLMVLTMTVPAMALTADTTVTVNGIEANDTVKLYKVLEPDQSSSTGWKLTTDYSSVTGITVSDLLDGITSTEAETLAEHTTNSSISETKSDTATSNGITFSDVDPGLYLVLVTPSNAGTIYNPAFVGADYDSSSASTINLSTAGYSDETILKKATLTVDKKVNGQDSTNEYSVGETLPFTITTNIPSYPSNSTNATFTITDTPNGTTIDSSTAKVTVAGTEVTAGDTTYTKSYDDQTGVLTVTFVKSYILAHPGDTVVVSYNATLTTVNAVSGQASNTAQITYNPNPFSNATSTKDDTVTESTYGIVFQKMDSDGTTALAGAGFTLYEGDVSSKTDHSSDTVAGAEKTSPDTGYVYWSGLKGGTYTIVETSTPSGYKTAAPVVVTLDGSTATGDNPATTEVTETNYWGTSETITNDKGSSLPSTGGIGTTLFYIVGGALIIGAAVVLVVRRRKAQ